MGQVIDDRNDEWYEFVKHVIEQEITLHKPIDELIFEALKEEPEDRSKARQPS